MGVPVATNALLSRTEPFVIRKLVYAMSPRSARGLMRPVPRTRWPLPVLFATLRSVAVMLPKPATASL